jgi:CubicO group peptidase (beta-lactamase class C family)
MKTCLIFLCACILSSKVVAQQPSTKAAAIVKRLEHDIPALLKKGDVPGISIAYVSNGHVAWHRAFGVANAKTKVPVTDNSVFEAASLSKPVVAYAVMKLVDQGKLDLDEPLIQYLPAPYPDVYDTRIKLITARHILSHTSGFPNWRNSDTLKIFFNPGDRFSYSGEGFVYLSKVIESISGEKFDAFMKRMVFDPLGMQHSSYSWKDEYDNLKTFRHNTTGEAVSQDKMQAGYYNAASSLHTTASDYGRFIEAVLNGEGLKTKTQQAMLTASAPVFKEGIQTVNRPKAQPFPGVSWALGWGIQDIQHDQSFFHWGDNGDFKAFVVGRQKEKDAIVIFTNSYYGLSIVPDIVSSAWNIDLPAIAWLRIEPYDSPSRELFRNLLNKGAATVLPAYLEWRKGQPASGIANEERMNDIGLGLLRLGKVADAIAVLKQNVADHPESFNVYDSLGEAYATAGEKELAIENYEISVRINPHNEGGVKALKKLKGG